MSLYNLYLFFLCLGYVLLFFLITYVVAVKIKDKWDARKKLQTSKQALSAKGEKK